jgi:hypothetical protein
MLDRNASGEAGRLRQAKGPRFTGLAVAGTLGVLLSCSANGTTFEDLAGYSIEARLTLTVVWRELNPRSTETQITQRTYFSTSGRIFDYSNYAAGGFADRRPTVMALNQPQSVGRGNMQLWTMQGGNLTLVVRLVEGLLVRTIAIDPADAAAAGWFDGRNGFCDTPLRQLRNQTRQRLRRRSVRAQSSFVMGVVATV